jgi:serine/threonine protein phosphatase PrpC
MKFFQDYLCQKIKTGYNVCGDFCLSERTATGMIYIVCDGVGSGIYANIAAITCANRILEMFRHEIALQQISETVAASMHRARKEDIPFSAFSAVVILPDGQFTAYSYESPNPILMQNNRAIVLTPRFYTTGFEVLGEVSGKLNLGDSILLFSDGISQAGLGHGYGMGIGSDGVADFINQNYKPTEPISTLSEGIVEMCRIVSSGKFEDDTTLVLINCKIANEMTLVSGPPSKQTLDTSYVRDFISMPGKKVICGSTTTDIVSRELKREVVTLSLGNSFGLPPEYFIEGIDIVAEGAITLNQVYNILEEPTERLSEGSVVERLCLMFHKSDVINFMIGNAINTAHDDLIFKQIGVHVRRATLQQMIEKLKKMGKLVIERYY